MKDITNGGLLIISFMTLVILKLFGLPIPWWIVAIPAILWGASILLGMFAAIIIMRAQASGQLKVHEKAR